MKNKLYFVEPVEPELNMPATIGIGSDSYPGTVVYINKEKTLLRVQMDNYTPDVANGYDYFRNQIYIYSRDKDNVEYIFTLRKNGVWVEKLKSMRYSAKLTLGIRRAYNDPSF